jgi:hypothetical protein
MCHHTIGKIVGFGSLRLGETEGGGHDHSSNDGTV